MVVQNLSAARTPLSEISLCGWIGQAAPGDILEYHRGFLVVDVNPQGTAASAVPSAAAAANCLKSCRSRLAQRVSPSPEGAGRKDDGR